MVFNFMLNSPVFMSECLGNALFGRYYCSFEIDYYFCIKESPLEVWWRCSNDVMLCLVCQSSSGILFSLSGMLLGFFPMHKKCIPLGGACGLKKVSHNGFVLLSTLLM